MSVPQISVCHEVQVVFCPTVAVTSHSNHYQANRIQHGETHRNAGWPTVCNTLDESLAGVTLNRDTAACNLRVSTLITNCVLASGVKVGHIVSEISGTSIPVEIATTIDAQTETTSRLISTEPVDAVPDTVDSDIVLTGLPNGPLYRNLCRELVERDFDILHTHHNRLAAKIGILSRWYDFTHVNTQHGHIHYTGPQKLVNAVTLVTTDGLLFNSTTTRNSYSKTERLLKQSVSEYLCYNGVNIDRIDPHVTEVDDVEVAVTACRLIERKNLETLIRAVAQTDLDLRIIGDGPHRETLERLAATFEGPSEVEFLGYIENRADVYEEMARGDVFVLPSHAEGFGVSLAEAMALGLPTVVSDIPVFHEVAGDAGVFVDKDSPDAVAAGLERVQSNPEHARELGERAKRRIRENFTLTRTAQCYEDAYREIVSGQ